MATNCSTNIRIYFCPPTVDFECWCVGLSFPFQFTFKDRRTGSEIDITADTFSLIVTDSTGVTVETMTVGSGLTIIADGILQGIFSSPTTDTAGRYTYELIWTITATGGVLPAAAGRIVVKA